MCLDFLKPIFAQFIEKQAFAYRNQAYSYGWLTEKLPEMAALLRRAGVRRGSIVALCGDFSPSSVSMLLALCNHNLITLPIAPTSRVHLKDFLRIAQAQYIVAECRPDEWQVTSLQEHAEHPIYQQLRTAGDPGLILFSSGTTSDPKGVVHDLTRLMTKYQVRRRRYRTLAFLLFDHIGGVDTLFQVLSSGGTLVVPEDRAPESVCKAVEGHRIEVLPVSPSFLKALILSEAYLCHDLSSLKYVTYGAELMPQSTLEKCAEIFPRAELLQKYGATEIGTLRSKSRSSRCLWVKIGGEGYETRVIDGMLEIKAASSMLGYLNAESPFTADGWFRTGDHVESDGEYVRFLGRNSDIINVGGRKVYPGEVEAVITELENIAEVIVHGHMNPLLGNVVCATVRTTVPEDALAVERRIRSHCLGRLSNYKVPIKVMLSDDALASPRSKLRRRQCY